MASYSRFVRRAEARGKKVGQRTYKVNPRNRNKQVMLRDCTVEGRAIVPGTVCKVIGKLMKNGL